MRVLPPAVTLLALAAALGSPSEARADAPAPRLVRVLRSARRPTTHPLAGLTGRVPITVPLPDGTSARDLGLLPVAPGVGAIRLAPDQIDAFAAAHPGLSLHVAPPRMPLMDRSREWTRLDEFQQNDGGDGKGVVVGVIDTGVDITHPDFRDTNGKTRIAWMIRLGEPRGVHKELEEEYGCNKGDKDQSPCAIYSAADIDAILAAGTAEKEHLTDEGGHGTHVASIAAGNGGLMAKSASPYAGIAPGATLIVAGSSLPGGGFEDPDILNAARFIFDRTAEFTKDPKNPTPAVINLSVGSDFGPHDGTSDLERGLAAMVGDDKPGRAIVTAAGNSGSLYTFEGYDTPFGIHTEVHVAPSTDTRVPIMAPGAKHGEGFVWITFRPGDEVSVGLEGPGGKTWIGLTEPGTDRGYDEDGATAGVINNIRNDKAPIREGTNSAVIAWNGEWPGQSEFAVLLRGHGDAQLWLVSLGDIRPPLTEGLLFEKAIKQGTITVPASHPNLLAVGCSINRVTWEPFKGSSGIRITTFGGTETLEEDSMCYFSSSGPTPLGVPKPEITAPGGFIAAAMSAGADPRTHPGSIFASNKCPEGNSCFVVDDRHAVTMGSSMSAPHVAGAIALLFQKNRKLTQAQVTDVLQAGARYPKGAVPYEPQLGPGALDIEGARQALAKEEEENPSSIEPDVTKSWFVVSSDYVRPDPSWPVWGTVELRRADGTVASGLAGTKLKLDVEGGTVVQPMTKVRHGLFRFAVAGLKGTSGTRLNVQVTYDGMSLGTRSLPVGTDIWVATGGIDPVGGCSASGRQAGRGSLFTLITLAGAGARLLRRRRKPGLRYADR